MTERTDNIQYLLRIYQAENVRLYKELADRDKYVRFLEKENRTIEAEVREECRASVERANHERDVAVATAEHEKRRADSVECKLSAALKCLDEARAKLKEQSHEVESLRKKVAELESYKEVVAAAEASKMDAEDVAEVLKRQMFGRKSDATRFLNGEVDPDSPGLEDLPLADVVKEVIHKVDNASRAQAASSKKSEEKHRKQKPARTGARSEEEKIRSICRRNVFSVANLETMGIDTSNLPPNSKLIRRKDKATGEDIWYVRVYFYEPAKVRCKQYMIGRFNVPGNDPMCSKHPDTIVKGNPLMPSFARFYLDSKINLCLPENRIIEMLKGLKTDMPQSSLNKWMHEIMGKLREQLEPMMLAEIRRSDYTHNDGTRILVRSRESEGAPFKYNVEYIQAALSTGRRLVVMLYDEGSRGHLLQEEKIFKGSSIKGFTSDRAPQYDAIVKDLKPMKIIRQACWFHGRHYLVEAFLVDNRMGEILMLINLLFLIERAFLKEKDTSPEARLKFRQKWSLGVVNRIMKKLEAIRAAGSEYGAMVHRAVNYILDDKEAFLNFLQDGGLDIHNNAIERCFRHIAVGRANWLQSGSHDAAQNIAFMFGLLESCKLNGIDFGEFVEDILTRILHDEKLDASALPCSYVPKFIEAEEVA